MKVLKKILLSFILFVTISLNFFSISSVWGAAPIDAYGEMLGATSRQDMKVDAVTKGGGGVVFNNQVIIIVKYAINIFIVIGIVVAFIGAYKIMTSDKEESSKEGIRLIVFGIIGIIIMVSARFLAGGLVGDFNEEGRSSYGIIGEAFGDNKPNGIQFASALYDMILYPFIKIALYFVVGILFFMMVGKIIGFVTATDDSAKKKAAGVIIRNVIGILIVMGAKQVVESVMGKQDAVLNDNAARIDDQTPGSILNFGKIPLVTQVINWVMGLTMFIILVLIIIQGYKMFTKPDDPKNRESLKKTLLYIIIGVLVIGAAYAISSVLIINNVPLSTVSTDG